MSGLDPKRTFAIAGSALLRNRARINLATIASWAGHMRQLPPIGLAAVAEVEAGRGSLFFRPPITGQAFGLGNLLGRHSLGNNVSVSPGSLVPL